MVAGMACSPGGRSIWPMNAYVLVEQEAEKMNAGVGYKSQGMLPQSHTSQSFYSSPE